MLDTFDIAVLGGFAAYLVLQTIAVVWLPGALKVLSLGLAGFMAVAVGLSAQAYLDRIHPWTVFLQIATPPALVLVVGLLMLGAVVTGRRRSRTTTRASYVRP
jgi:hypothetical protein